jgi:hypothetical protein
MTKKISPWTIPKGEEESYTDNKLTPPTAYWLYRLPSKDYVQLAVHP